MTILVISGTPTTPDLGRFAKHASIAKCLHDVTMSDFRPARGARIETPCNGTPGRCDNFRPARGARIETDSFCVRRALLHAFAPHAGRGLKRFEAWSTTTG